MIWSAIVGIAGTTAVGFVMFEIPAASSWVALKLMRVAVRRLPARVRGVKSEEWAAELEAVEKSQLVKILLALSFVRAANRIMANESGSHEVISADPRAWMSLGEELSGSVRAAMQAIRKALVSFHQGVVEAAGCHVRVTLVNVASENGQLVARTLVVVDTEGVRDVRVTEPAWANSSYIAVLASSDVLSVRDIDADLLGKNAASEGRLTTDARSMLVLPLQQDKGNGASYFIGFLILESPKVGSLQDNESTRTHAEAFAQLLALVMSDALDPIIPF